MNMFILIFSGEQYAFIFDSALLEYASSLPPCHTETVGPIFHPLGYGLAFQRNSRYTDLMSQHILQLRESGRLDKLYDKWFRNNNTECDDNGGTFIVMFLMPANDVWGEVMFLHVCVILFRGVLCPSMHHKSHDKRVCVQGGLCVQGVSVWGSLSRWGVCPGGSLSKGGLSRVGKSLSKGVSVRETPIW